MRKVVTKVGQGMSPITEFHAQKKSNTAPGIEFVFIDDDTGEVMYELDNGRQQSKANYDKFWNPVKTEIKPQHYKGDISTRNKIK